MGKRLTPLEKFARRICWEGFLGPMSGRGTTEAAYWDSLPESTKKNYLCDAERYIWVWKNVDPAIVREACES